MEKNLKKVIFGGYNIKETDEIINSFDSELSTLKETLNSEKKKTEELRKLIDKKNTSIENYKTQITNLNNAIKRERTLNERIVENAKVRANQIEIDSLAKLNTQLEQKVANFENEFSLKKENAAAELRNLDEKLRFKQSQFDLIVSRLNDIIGQITNTVSSTENYIIENEELISDEKGQVDNIIEADLPIEENKDELNEDNNLDLEKINKLVQDSLKELNL